MDIKNLNNNLVGARNDNLRTANAPAAQTENDSAKKLQTDKVTLTSTSSQIRELEKRANQATHNNEARIAELKQAIEDGSYKVDAQSIAQKLISTELLLSNA